MILTDIRLAAVAAVRADLRFAAFTLRRAWAQNIEVSGPLREFGVSVPRMVSAWADKESLRRVIDLDVRVLRTGGDSLESEVEADIAAIETAVMAGVGPLVLDVAPALADLQLSGEAARRIANLGVRFSVVVLTDVAG